MTHPKYVIHRAVEAIAIAAGTMSREPMRAPIDSKPALVPWVRHKHLPGDQA